MISWQAALPEHLYNMSHSHKPFFFCGAFLSNIHTRIDASETNLGICNLPKDIYQTTNFPINRESALFPELQPPR